MSWEEAFPPGQSVFLGEDGARVLWTEARRALSMLHGELWECGVYTGDSARVIAEAAVYTQPRIVRLFDTFAGLPEPGPNDTFHTAGEFACSLVEVQSNLRRYKEFVAYHEGLIPATFAGLEESVIAFAHLDLDLYEPTAAAIDFIWPRLEERGVIVFDDWQWEKTPGVTQAILERLPREAIRETSQRGPTGPKQALIRKEIRDA